MRELCEFAAKSGDLDLRFTPSPSAEEGIAGHRTVAARRGATHRTEVALTGRFDNLVVRGRADGFDASRGLLEEVKTFKGDLERMPANHRALHWAQAKVYGWLLCEQFALAELTVSLVYFDIDSGVEVPLSERCSASALRQVFETVCGRFLQWATRQLQHRHARDAHLAALSFPHASFRGGQRQLAEQTYRAVQLGRCLMAQAPTGIGKTVGTLFPLLKAMPAQRLDKVFFLTAKTPGREVALEALRALQGTQATRELRVIEFASRDSACEHPGLACHGDSCPLAKGFYDRLPAARDAAVQQPLLSKEALRQVALAHAVCPYYLSQELVRWADVVVGDYNYYFDGSALLHSLTRVNEWRVAVLVDEAHNLVDRARAMYTAELGEHLVREVARAAPPALKTALRRVRRAWGALTKNQTTPYQVHGTPPDKLVSALREATTLVGEHLAQGPQGVDDTLLRFYFEALQFGRLAETFDTHSLFDVSLPPANATARSAQRDSVVCIRNVVPAAFLGPRFAATRATVLFSATLSPQHFYADTLGVPENAAWLDVDAPFKAEQLSVRIVSNVSTRFARRDASLAPIAELMAAQYRAAPGNYLAYFSSFDYLAQVRDRFIAHSPEVPIWQQSRRMDEREREDFLARFTPGGAGIAFAVLGGAFAEGIDLPGTRLIGAFIATLGLPQLNPVNEQMKQRTEEVFGAGYDYTYLYPGLRKVVQAAGRVIRTPTDRGHVILIDDRFQRPEVQRLLPRWWALQTTRAQQKTITASETPAESSC